MICIRGFSSYLSVIDFWFNSIVVCEQTLISVLLILLRCVLWPRMWSISENVSHEFEKNNQYILVLKNWNLKVYSHIQMTG